MAKRNGCELENPLKRAKRDNVPAYRCESAKYADIQRTLLELGVCVVPAATAADLVDLEDRMWADLAMLGTGIDRKDSTTMANANWPGLFSVGIVKDSSTGLSNADSTWRGRELAYSIFEELYREDEKSQPLITSFDGLRFFRNHTMAPDTKTAKKWRTKPAWWHVDQGRKPIRCPKPSQRECIQGLLTLYNTDEVNTGGFACVLGSHKNHADIVTKLGKKANGNYVPLTSEIIDEYVGANGGTFIKAKAGDLILWDSRTIHTNQPPTSEAPDCARMLLAAAFFVCFVPRAWATEEDAKTRQKVFVADALSSHWPVGMRREYMRYPRHKSFKKLQSAAMKHSDILGKYDYMLMEDEWDLGVGV